MNCLGTLSLALVFGFASDRSLAFAPNFLSFTMPKHLPTASQQHPSRLAAYFQGDESAFEELVLEATKGSEGSVYGGDFAGLAATFRPGDGSFIPIPDYLIPDGLKEWGQEPKCLEVLVSEDVHDDEHGEGYVMSRVTTKILPDTGCTIDNLETMLVRDEIDLESQWKSNGDGDNEEKSLSDVVGLQYPLGEDKLRVETIFGLEEEDGLDRIRVAIDLIPSEDNFAIQSPMVLTLERRTSAISSGGTISGGGGLDGRTVFLLLGQRLRASTTFVDEPSLTLNSDNSSYELDFDSDIRYVGLPANIGIAYGWSKDGTAWMLQVSQVKNGLRRVVSRQFTLANDGELDFEIRTWVEDFHPEAVYQE